RHDRLFDFRTIPDANRIRNSAAMAKAPICWMPAGRSRKPAAAVTTAKMKNAKLSMVFSPAYSKVRKSSKMHAAMLKRSKAPAGTVVVLEHSSQVLKDNPWGDPHV